MAFTGFYELKFSRYPGNQYAEFLAPKQFKLISLLKIQL